MDIQVGEQTAKVDLIVSDVHRNEQVNIIALSKGWQTVLCSKLAYGKYYALWPMKVDSCKYTYSRVRISVKLAEKVRTYTSRLLANTARS